MPSPDARVLTAHVEKEEERHRLTLEALAEADAVPGVNGNSVFPSVVIKFPHPVVVSCHHRV